MSLTRRQALKLAGAGAVGALVGAAGCRTDGMSSAAAETALLSGAVSSNGRYVLPALPYAVDALEPVIDARTVDIHHGKHHAGYVRAANAILDKLDAARSGSDYGAIKALSRGLAFAASGVVLHNLYWLSMSPKVQAGPAGRLAAQIKADFGSLGAMKAQLAAAAKAVEGSGWAVLVWEPTVGRLLVLQIEKHQDLAIWGSAPLMVCDVWEHAYYVKYQNARASYVDAWIGIIDWAAAGDRFDAAAAV